MENYLYAGANIHADDEEGVEVSEDVSIDKKNGGMESQKELGEKVAEDKWDDQINTSKHHSFLNPI